MIREQAPEQPLAHVCWAIEQTAPVAERGGVGDCAALAAPGEVPPARARDAANQHPSRPQDMPVRAMRRWPHHPRARRRPHRLADASHMTRLGGEVISR
jgi:hypothetical protein